MGNTIYASFDDSSLAEKAAGALLDFGVRPEDISVVQSRNGIEEVTTNPNSGTWQGQAGTEENVPGYTGSVYGTPVGNNNIPPSALDIQATNIGYGDTASRTAEFDDSGKPLWNDNTVAAGEGYRAPETNQYNEARDVEGGFERAAKDGISTTTPADAGAGAVKGAGWGLGVGVLAAVASLMVPGVGLVIGGGALATAIGAAAATAGAGAIAGGVTGYLKDQGMEEHIAANYERAIQNGGALLAVNTPSGKVDETQIRQIIDKYGAAHVNNYAARGYVA